MCYCGATSCEGMCGRIGCDEAFDLPDFLNRAKQEKAPQPESPQGDSLGQVSQPTQAPSGEPIKEPTLREIIDLIDKLVEKRAKIDFAIQDLKAAAARRIKKI